MWRGDQIFISYRGTQHIAADRIGDHLKARGYVVWRDAERLQHEIGAAWPDELDRQVRASAALIACLSPEYFESDWCKRELQTALDLKKHVYPIWIAPPTPSQPTPVDHLQHLSLVPKDSDFDAVMRLLISNLRQGNIQRGRRYALPRAAALIGIIGLALIAALLLRPKDKLASPDFPRFDDLQQVHNTANQAISQVAGSEGGLWFIQADPQGGSDLFWAQASSAITGAAAQNLFHIPGDETILDLSVDCQGTAWIAVKDVGVYAVPAAGDSPLKLDKTQFAAWDIGFNSIPALASRCASEQVEVYLGREAVHTLRYPAGDLTEYELLDPGDDLVFQQSTGLPGVITALLLVPDAADRAKDRLWVLPNQGDRLVHFAVGDTLSKQVVEAGQIELFESIAAGPDGAVWIGTQARLLRIDASGMLTGFPLPAEVVARTLAVAGEWVWIGSWCQDAEGQRRTDCTPLTVYHQGRFEPLHDAGTLVAANRLWADSVAVWMATDNGLLYRPAGS